MDAIDDAFLALLDELDAWLQARRDLAQWEDDGGR